MIIQYLRSSSYNGYDWCPHKYFLNMNLGLEEIPFQKTIKGTICHKTLECLAIIKKAIQENPEVNEIEEEKLGKIQFNPAELLKPRVLSNLEVDQINSTRINKYVYEWDCKLKYGHIRFGDILVNELVERSYDYYSKKYTCYDWKNVDKNDCYNFTHIPLEFSNGQFDPRRKEVFATELEFDIPLEKPEFQYYAEMPNGQEVVDYLRLKGTIDLVFKLNELTLELCDWKTGAAKTWSTGEKKDAESIKKDFQLQFYYYILRKLFPQYKDILVSIFYIRSAGPFSVCFDDSTVEEVEKLIHKRFIEIQKDELPKLLDPSHKDFKCNKLCYFYKNKFNGTNQTICDHIHQQIKNVGIDEVQRTMMNPNFTLGKYNQPGE